MIDILELRVRSALSLGLLVGLLSYLAMVVIFGVVMFLTGPPVSFVPHQISIGEVATTAGTAPQQ